MSTINIQSVIANRQPRESKKSADYNLTHHARYSVSQFNKEAGIDSIDVLPADGNKGTGFMVDNVGNSLGAVSKAVMDAISTGEEFTPVISIVTVDDQPDAQPFFLMHKRGEGKASVATFK